MTIGTSSSTNKLSILQITIVAALGVYCSDMTPV